RIQTSTGTMRQHKPALYQEVNGVRRRVAGRFRKIDRFTVGFEVSRYDRDLPLSIDPVLELSTYLGGGQDDTVVALDATRRVGTTTSIDFPGANAAARKRRDIFVSGVSAGFAGVTSTFIYGGSGDEQVTSAGFSPAPAGDTIVVGGYTDSQDLPAVNQLG